jgi:integrase
MLIVDGSIKKNGVRPVYNKKGHRDYWKLRIVPLPDLTLGMLKEHIERKRLNGDDFIFTANKEPSRPVPEHYVRDHMARIIREAGIQLKGRKLTPHSFRYTYAARLRRELPAGIVMELIGYRMTGMREYCRKRGIDESLADITGADTAVEILLT